MLNITLKINRHLDNKRSVEIQVNNFCNTDYSKQDPLICCNNNYILEFDNLCLLDVIFC